MASSRRRQSEKLRRQTLQRMVRRRLDQPGARTSVLLRKIRLTRPDAPTFASKYDLMAWFCANTPLRKERERGVVDPASPEFLLSNEWRRLRMRVLVKRGRRCECCGATPEDGRTVINVDHIKPRKKSPELALVESNLQVLCDSCNQGKGNWDETDWRPKPLLVVESDVEPTVTHVAPGVAACAFISENQTVRVRSSARPAGLTQKQYGTLIRAADMTPRLVKR